MMAKAYLLMISIAAAQIALAFIFGFVERISSTKPFRVFCIVVYAALSIIGLFALAFVVLTLFVYLLPAIVAVAILYPFAKKSSLVKESLQKTDSMFFRIAYRITLVSALFLGAAGITFIILNVIKSV